MSDREEKFEAMLQAVQQNYADITAKMEKLKAEDKTKTATYRQLMGHRLTCLDMLSLYQTYGLIDSID